jgi:peptide/nickel transport system substrate-binding protein
MRLKRISQIFLLLLMLALLLAPGTIGSAEKEAAQGSQISLRIEGRDWGYPSPYAFYPRGPGYVRMTLLFDTLLWRDENGVIPARTRMASFARWQGLVIETGKRRNLA